MPSEDTLEFLKDHLSQSSLDCELVDLEESGRRLLIFLGTDGREKGLTLEVTAQEYSMDGKLFSEAFAKDNAFVRVQFDLAYNFAVKDEATLDVAQFLHFLNLQMEIPGFYLNPLDNKVLYRYVWLCKYEQMDPKLAFNIVTMAMFFQGIFESVLDRLASGNVSYIQLLEEILKPET